MNEKDILKGNHGEEHFLDFELWGLFGLHRNEVKDLRGNNREGEVLLPDGRLVEVKSDHSGNMARYGNVLVEVNHPEHEGWYHHCRQNGVTNLIFEAFRGKKKDRPHPYFVLHVVFDELRELIEIEENTFEKTYDGCLKVPIRRIFETCAGTKIISSVELTEDITALAQTILRITGRDEQLRAMGIDPQPRSVTGFVQGARTHEGENDQCNSYLPEDLPVFSITLTDPPPTRK